MNNPMYSPYANFGMQPKTPQQMQNEINALMTQYQGVYSQAQGMTPQPPVTQSNQAVSERGEFVKVSGIDEVSEAPTRLDGTATLFFDFKNHVFWSKKFANGAHSIQAFQFQPINSANENTDAASEDVDYTKIIDTLPPDQTEERLAKLESSIAKLLNDIETLINNKAVKLDKKSTAKITEEIKDEI